MIREYLNNRVLLADGAIGTYYLALKDDLENKVELANITDPDTILRIHNEYINSGSKLIRTNTFSANTKSLGVELEELATIIEAAWLLANKAKGAHDLFIAANIGPIPQLSPQGAFYSRKDLLDEYQFIIDCFVGCGATIFNLETFSSMELIPEITEYIKLVQPNSFIALQYGVMKSGHTREGIYAKDLLLASDSLNIDVLGFNCGSGPTHLLSNIKKVPKTGKFLSSYPNSGYPEIINQRTVFNSNPNYFAEVLAEAKDYGVKIIGGCCGTTPEHISCLNHLLYDEKLPLNIPHTQPAKTSIEDTLTDKDLIIAVELDPPFKPDLKTILKSAKDLKDIGVNIITLADSPSGRVRLNPIMVASKIRREVGIEVMPHICCRDRNLIALESDILAAHTEGIRKLLLVTGDPVPAEQRAEVKKVFNCNSVTLMKKVHGINKSLLEDSPFVLGGALNLSANKLDNEIIKMDKKIEAGATLFLTQPIYDTKSIDYLLNIKKKKGIKILAGIMPLVTYKNAQFLNNEFPGISIPEEVIHRFKPEMDRESAERIGVQIAIDTVNRLKVGVDGFYFITPFFRTNMIKSIITGTKLL